MNSYLIETKDGRVKYVTDQIEFLVFKNRIRFYAHTQSEFYDYGTSKFTDVGYRTIDINSVTINQQPVERPNLIDRIFIKLTRILQ